MIWYMIWYDDKDEMLLAADAVESEKMPPLTVIGSDEMF